MEHFSEAQMEEAIMEVEKNEKEKKRNVLKHYKKKLPEYYELSLVLDKHKGIKLSTLYNEILKKLGLQ